MRQHTNNFANAMSKNGRQIQGKIKYNNNFGLIAEDDSILISEEEYYIKSENENYDDKVEIQSSDIYAMDIIKNGELFQTLMAEFDFETTVELSIGSRVVPSLGVLVDKATNNYNFIDYQFFYIKEKEYDYKTQHWNYVCYDSMMFFMKPYKPLEITYPTTIGKFLRQLCAVVKDSSYQDSETQSHLKNNWPFYGWKSSTVDRSINYSQPIKEDLFKNKNLTYRDVLDKIALILGGNILTTGYGLFVVINLIDAHVENLTKKELKSINVNYKKINPFNQVRIINSSNNINVIAQNKESIRQYGVQELKIVDNEFALNGNANQIAQNLVQQISTKFIPEPFYLYEAETTGICFFDYLETLKYNNDNKEYKCYIVNNEINITQGIEELIHHMNLNTEITSNDDYMISK